ncbi:MULTISPECIES: hypothetical protein [Vitreoscilla]|uniref:Lipoprotein n=1 Tax=Vitreoscilla stercoraria TaxID=61 RepID=A0ABY4E9K7_VITST|nr:MULTISPECIES: hypothetical protein [Vitreoscilla]AUZ04711.1 hypothetical protein ADP71_10020 [Vitreoscilla sp. C1]UOO91605.1 hypothetical protein LVJ81_08085 [Vitreoscilla stercoraria]
MKHIITATVLALTLAACAGGTTGLGYGNTGSTGNTNAASGLGKTLVQSYARNQCSVELNKRQEWRLMALAVSADKQAQWEEQICGCVSEEAPNSVTVYDLTQAAVNPQARTEIVANAVTKTVSSCLNRLVK